MKRWVHTIRLVLWAWLSISLLPTFHGSAQQPLQAVNRHGDTFEIEWGPVQEAYSNGFQRLAERQLEESLLAFDNAFRLAKEAGWDAAQTAGIHTGRASALHQLGRFPEAMESLLQGLPHETGNALTNARYLQVEIARAMGDFRTATDTLKLISPEAFVPEVDLASSRRQQRESIEIWARQRILLSEARNRRAWGDLMGARDIFEQALKEAEVLNVELLRDYARIQLAIGEEKTAFEYAQKALNQSLHIRGTTRRRPTSQWVEVGDAEVLSCLMVAAQCAWTNGERAVADRYYTTAAALAQRLGLPEEWHLALLQQARAWMLDADPQLETIDAAWLQTKVDALSTSTQIRARLEGLTLSGELAFRIQNYPLTIAILQNAVEDIEAVRATASHEDRRTFLEMQADSYRRLTAAYIRNGQPWEALAAAEALKARQLNELLNPRAAILDQSSRITRLQQLQKRLPQNVATITYANADWSETPPAAIVLTEDNITAMELSSAQFRFELEYLSRDRILDAQAREVDATRYGSSPEVTLAGLIAFYREALICPPSEIPQRAPDVLAVSPVLYRHLIAPLKKAIEGCQRLLISPSGLLHYLPFDTLITGDNQFLVSSHSITLTPSLETTLVLSERTPVDYEEPLIAFGGAIYNPADYAQTMARVGELREQLRLLREVRANQVAATRSPYYGVFGGPSNNLAGTQAEVEELGELLPGSRIITGSKVSEPYVRELARQGAFQRSRVIHFAVHGSALPSMPELSCISLSYEGHFTREMPANRDGKLSLAEIRALPLRADLVTLSACQTGLGAIFAGEGVVGLNAAFLTAGADRMLTSLWEVNDVSTTFFMVELYRRHFVEEESADIAVAKVKRSFLANSPPGFRHPQYWAPFNLYGGADLLMPVMR